MDALKIDILNSSFNVVRKLFLVFPPIATNIRKIKEHICIFYLFAKDSIRRITARGTNMIFAIFYSSRGNNFA